MHPTLRSAWSRAKQSHVAHLGPVSLFLRLGRGTRVSGNHRRRLREVIARWSATTGESTALEPMPARATRDAEGQVAVVVGVGPGLGQALVRRLAREGMSVAMLARRPERLDPFAHALRATAKGRAVAYGCDATLERSVRSVLAAVRAGLGEPDLVVYCVEGFHPGWALDVEVCAFEDSWRHTCLGAFVVAREAGRAMAERGRGTIVFTGASSSVYGRPGYLNLSVGKFGVRAMSQVMAKELAPRGVHVAHLLIDGGIEEEGQAAPPGRELLDADALAEIVWSLHQQPRRAWTNELDVRAGDEAWWQRC